MSSSELYINSSFLKSVVGSTTRSSLGRYAFVTSIPGELLVQNSPLSLEYKTAEPYARRLKGIDVGSTSEGNGSIWVSSSTSTLRYAYNGRQYDCYRAGIGNRISGSTLYIYSNSARTNLVATVAYSSSALSYVNINGGVYYYRFTGSGGDSYTGSFTLYNGWIHTFTGDYDPSQDDVYECNCVFSYNDVFATGNLPTTWNCNTFADDDGCWSLRENKICQLQCSPSSDPTEQQCSVYTCQTEFVSGSTPQSWSVSLSIS